MAKDTISFSGPPLPTNDLSDQEFLQALDWRKGADSRLTSAAEAGDPRQFARLLRRNLRSNRSKKRLQPGVPQLLQPLWSRHAFEEQAKTERAAEFLMSLHRCIGNAKTSSNSKNDASKLIEHELDASQRSDSTPLSLLKWLTVLSAEGTELLALSLFALWRRTLEEAIAIQMRSDVLAEEVDKDDRFDDRHLLFAGELPWRIGLGFPELRGAGKLRKSGRRCLRDGLEALTDDDGTPHARALDRLPLTLAVLTRSTIAGEAAGEPLWEDKSADRYSCLVSRAAALSHADGRIALSNGASFAPASLLRSAVQIAGLSKHDPSPQLLRALPDDGLSSRLSDDKQRFRFKRRQQQPAFKADESPSSQSDWAELACLRNNWHMGADRCIIAHDAGLPRMSLTAFDRVLINGDWRSDVLMDGKPMALDQPWECVCWFSDEDVDYIELQQEGDGVTSFRQVALSRTDHWLFVSEAVLAPQATTLDLITRLPLAEDVTAKTARWTRELQLSRQKLKATVFPLSLDQQRVIHAHGSLEAQDGEVRLKQSVPGTALFAPLVIDWSPARRRSQAQWRQLTVAEDGIILGPSDAAGFRLQVGKHQWLFYRSLKAGKTARTFLGYHTPHETVIAEFTADGEVEPLVMVE